jgi:hypothetical protein
VRHGDPTTFTVDKFSGVQRIGRSAELSNDGKPYGDAIQELFNKDFPVAAVVGVTPSFPGKPILWHITAASFQDTFVQQAVYRNYDQERSDELERKKTQEALLAKRRLQQAEAERVQKAQQAEAARVQEAHRAAQILGARKAEADIQSRSAAFVTANGVKHFVTIQQLAANPFVYQGQVVAVYAVFAQMNSASEGLFGGGEFSDALLVSGVPSARFTQANSMVMLAGRVIGKQEVKLPLLGPTMVPHLSFVGSAFCQQQRCADYNINLR